MAHDPLDIIAESYRGIHESTQIMAQTQLRMEATQRLALRLQGFALVLIGLSLFFAAYLVYQHGTQGQEHAAHTQALIEMLRRTPAP
jgi:hypothetical protein